MTTRCAPACSQALPVKPQGVWARGIEAWAWSRDRRNLEFLRGGGGGVFRALQPNEKMFFKHTTIDVPSGIQTMNFQSSVIRHHEFNLMGNSNVYIGENLFEKPNCILGGLNFGRYWTVSLRWPQLVGMTYYHDTGHIPKISNHSVIM